jgi:hypothetical protein
MSETKWTEGKWTPTPDGQHVGIEEDFADGHNWMSICQVFTHSLVPPSQMKANARLISAAPDLAEALDDILMALDLPGDHCELEPAKERARAVLRKAKGEKT